MECICVKVNLQRASATGFKMTVNVPLEDTGSLQLHQIKNYCLQAVCNPDSTITKLLVNGMDNFQDNDNLYVHDEVQMDISDKF